MCKLYRIAVVSVIPMLAACSNLQYSPWPQYGGPVDQTSVVEVRNAANDYLGAIAFADNSDCSGRHFASSEAEPKIALKPGEKVSFSVQRGKLFTLDLIVGRKQGSMVEQCRITVSMVPNARHQTVVATQSFDREQCYAGLFDDGGNSLPVVQRVWRFGLTEYCAALTGFERDKIGAAP